MANFFLCWRPRQRCLLLLLLLLRRKQGIHEETLRLHATVIGLIVLM